MPPIEQSRAGKESYLRYKCQHVFYKTTIDVAFVGALRSGMSDKQRQTKEDLREGIEELIALADLLELSLVGAMLDSALSVIPTDVHH
jgi:hypothetical protein